MQNLYQLVKYSLKKGWTHGPSKFYTAGIEIFDLFCSCDLDLDPTTFICELNPYFLEIYQMCKYELTYVKGF